MNKLDNRGGAREGAGRPPKPPKQYSEEFKSGILKSLRKKARYTGKTIYDVFTDMLYDTNIQDTVRASLFKILAETMVVKESKQTVETADVKKVIILPEVKPVPPPPEEKPEPGLAH